MRTLIKIYTNQHIYLKFILIYFYKVVSFIRWRVVNSCLLQYLIVLCSTFLKTKVPT